MKVKNPKFHLTEKQTYDIMLYLGDYVYLHTINGNTYKGNRKTILRRLFKSLNQNYVTRLQISDFLNYSELMFKTSESPDISKVEKLILTIDEKLRNN